MMHPSTMTGVSAAEPSLSHMRGVAVMAKSDSLFS